MAEVDPIALAVETSGVEKGIRALNSLAELGPKVEKSMEGVESAAKDVNKSVSNIGEGGGKGLKDVESSAKGASDGLKRVSDSADGAEKAVKKVGAAGTTGIDKLGSASSNAAKSVASMSAAYNGAATGVQAFSKAATTVSERLLQEAQSVKASSDAHAAMAKQVSSLTLVIDKLSASSAALSTSSDKAAASMNKLVAPTDGAKDGLKSATKDVDSLSGSLGNLAAIAAKGFALGELIKITDEYIKYTAQIRLATDSTASYGVALNDVRNIARTAQQDISTLGTLYARIANATKEMGTSQADVAKITETVALSLKVSGASAQESASAMLQLSQAFASGVLRGEEFNAVNEAAPRLMKALADGIGMPVGALREMATQGKLTSDVLANALPKALGDLRKEAQEVQTISGAFTVLKNNVMEFVGSQAQASGAVKLLSTGIVTLADNLDLIAAAAVGFGAAKLATALLAAGIEAGKSATSAIAYASALNAQRVASIAATQATLANTAANTAYATATATAATAATVASRAMGALGGPIGLISTLLGIGVTAWMAWGSASKSESDKAASSTRESTRDIIGNLDKQIAKLRERQVLLATGKVDLPAASSKEGEEAARLLSRLNEIRAKGSKQTQMEQLEVIDLQGNYDDLISKIGEKNKVQTAVSSLQNADNLKSYLETDARLTKQQQRERDIAKAREDNAKQVAKAKGDENAQNKLEVALRQELLAIDDKYKDKKTGGSSAGQSELASLQARVKETQRYIDSLKAVGLQAEKANEGERIAAKLQEELAGKLSATARASKEKQLAAANELASVIKLKDATEAQLKAQKDFEDARAKQESSAEDSITKIEEQARAIENQVDAYGMGAEALAALTVARLQEKKARLEQFDGSDAEVERINREIEAIMRLGAANQMLAGKKVVSDSEKILENARDLIAEYQDEYRLTGMSAVERAKIVAQRKVELDYAKKIRVVELSGADAASKAEAIANLEAAKREEISAATNKVIQDDFAKTSAQIEQSLTDALMRGFENGKGFAENFRDTLKNMINTLVLRPVVSAIVQPVAGAVTGVVNSALGLGSSSGNIVGSMSNVSSMFNSPVLSNFGLGAGMSVNQVGTKLFEMGAESVGESLMDLGVTIAENAEVINAAGAALSYGSAIYSLSQGKYVSAVGTAAGQLLGGPIGAAIGSTLGGLVDSLFGGDDIPRYAASAEYRGGVTSKGWTPDDQWNDALYPMVNGLAGAIGSALDATANAFGKTAGYELSTTFSKDAENNGIFGTLNIIGPDGKSLADWSKYDKDWGGRWFSDGDAGTKEFMAAITADVKSAFLTIDLPGWAKDMYSVAEGADGLQTATQGVVQILSQFNALGQSMSMFADITGDMQTQLIRASGGMAALGNNAGAFYQGFYTEAERAESLRNQVNKSLESLGFSIDPSLGNAAKDEYRLLVEQVMAQGNGELAAQLLSLSGTFATVADYAEGLGVALDGLSDTMKKLAEERKTLEAELMRANGNEAGYLAAMREIATNGYTDAERAAWDYNDALRAQIELSKSAKSNAFSNLQDAVSREKTYWQSIASSSQSAINNISGILDVLTNNASELYGTVESTQGMRAASGMVYIEEALDALRKGASVTEYTGLSDAVEAAVSGISEGAYVSQFERERDALILAGQLSELGDLTGSQLTIEQRQLKAAQAQIESLDLTLDYWRQQIDGNQSQLDATLSVESAIKALALALGKTPEPSASWDGVGKYEYGGGQPLLDEIIDYGKQNGNDAFYFMEGVNDFYAKQQAVAGVSNITGQSPEELWSSMFGQGQEFWQAAQQASNAGLVVKETETLEEILARLAGMPSFDVGTNYVPRDMIARIHEGEAIIPKAFNPFAGGGFSSGSSDSSRLESLVEGLTTEVQRLQGIVAVGNNTNAQTFDLLDQVTEGGNLMRTSLNENLTSN